MKIRKSKKEDLERMMEIYAHARDFMAKTGNPRQWGKTGWPTEERIRQDQEEGNGYVCEENGEIVGTFYFRFGENPEPCYQTISGAWTADPPYGVVHRIAAGRRRRGVGGFCLNYALHACGHLRIDTHPSNRPMRALLQKLGFSMRGVIYVEEDDMPRYAYEKI